MFCEKYNTFEIEYDKKMEEILCNEDRKHHFELQGGELNVPATVLSLIKDTYVENEAALFQTDDASQPRLSIRYICQNQAESEGQ